MILHIENMTCGGCARAVGKAITRVDAQARVEADPPRRRDPRGLISTPCRQTRRCSVVRPATGVRRPRLRAVADRHRGP